MKRIAESAHEIRKFVKTIFEAVGINNKFKVSRTSSPFSKGGPDKFCVKIEKGNDVAVVSESSSRKPTTIYYSSDRGETATIFQNIDDALHKEFSNAFVG